MPACIYPHSVNRWESVAPQKLLLLLLLALYNRRIVRLTHSPFILAGWSAPSNLFGPSILSFSAHGSTPRAKRDVGGAVPNVRLRNGMLSHIARCIQSKLPIGYMAGYENRFRHPRREPSSFMRFPLPFPWPQPGLFSSRSLSSVQVQYRRMCMDRENSQEHWLEEAQLKLDQLPALLESSCVCVWEREGGEKRIMDADELRRCDFFHRPVL